MKIGLGRAAWGSGRNEQLQSRCFEYSNSSRYRNRSPILFAFWSVLLSLLCATASATITIEIPEVSETVATNIRAFLSLTRYADRKDVTPEVMSRLQRRIVTETHQALEPLGYYDPLIDYTARQDGDNWTIRINVQPGRPVRLSEVNIDITGPGAQQSALRELLKQDSLKPGLRLNHGNYERVKGELIRTARNEGYLDAHLTKSALTIDRAERRASVDLQMDTGERYLYGAIDITQDVIYDEPMQRLLRMQSGDPYTLDSLLRTQYVLDDSQYFSSVDIESGDPDREAHTVPVTIQAGPRRRHRYGASLGFGTDTRVRGRFSWEDRRVNKDGHRFRVELLGSSVIKQITARYSIPVFDVALEKVEFTATGRDEERAELTSKLAEVGVGLTQAIGSWQRVLSVRLSNETTIEEANPGTGQGKTERTDLYVYPSISFSTLPSYLVGRKTRPYYVYAELRGSPQSLGSDASFLQLRLQGERVFDLSKLWHLRVRTDLGASWVADSSDLPASQRFFAGGERSVRGFGLNELSPLTDGKKVGGKHLAVGSIEIERDLPRNFGVAGFYDIGNAFNEISEPMHYAVGIGARYHIAVASFGVDIAQPLSDPGGPHLHLYISTEF
jgi:translocation and assembly module TamA